MLRLISATPSPFARKVRVALAEKGLAFELATEVPWDRTTTTPRYNPLEKLPILILEDGSSIYESSFILQYLEWTYPSPPLLPAALEDKIAARRLEVLCDGICDAVVLCIFEKLRGPSCSAEWFDRQRRKIEGGVREMARLVATLPYAVGDAFSLGDLCVVTALDYVTVRFGEFDWRGAYPDLAAFADRLSVRPSFAATVPVAQMFSDKVV